MAVILFKKGVFKIFDENSFQHELARGWFLSKAEAEADWDSKLSKKKDPEPETIGDEVGESEADKDALIKKLKARKAELLAKQDKE